jgi:hypothetical protein
VVAHTTTLVEREEPAGGGGLTVARIGVMLDDGNDGTMSIGIYDSSDNLVWQSDYVSSPAGPNVVEFDVTGGPTLVDGAEYRFAYRGTAGWDYLQILEDGGSYGMTKTSNSDTSFPAALPSGTNSSAVGQVGVWAENSSGQVILGSDDTAGYTADPGTIMGSTINYDSQTRTAGVQ